MACLVTRLDLPRVVEKIYQLRKSLLVGFLGDPALGDPACAEKRVIGVITRLEQTKMADRTVLF